MVSTQDFEEKKQEEVEGCISTEIFFDSIKKVEKIRGISDSTPATWRFTFSIDGIEEMITISNKDLMVNSTAFENLFKSRYGFFLPYHLTKKPEKGESNKWKKFQLFIEQIKEDKDPDETDEWIECDLLLSCIANLPRTIDGISWADKKKMQKTLYKKILEDSSTTYWCLKTDDVPMLAKELKLTTPTSGLIKVIKQRKLKRPDNPDCRISGTKLKVTNAWWFPEEVLCKYGLKTEEENCPLQEEGGY